MRPNDLRPLVRSDARDAGELLGRAFRDSPAYAAILAHLDPARRAAAITRLYRAFVDAAVRYHEPTGIWVDGRLAGVSLVLAPGQYPVRLLAKAWQARGVVTTGPVGILRSLRVDAYMARQHAREPHYYLFVLGVDPTMQGRGLGKELLRALAAKADAKGVSTYLETEKEINVRLYASAGYDVITDETVPHVGFRMWTMRRR